MQINCFKKLPPIKKIADVYMVLGWKIYDAKVARPPHSPCSMDSHAFFFLFPYSKFLPSISFRHRYSTIHSISLKQQSFMQTHRHIHLNYPTRVTHLSYFCCRLSIFPHITYMCLCISHIYVAYNDFLQPCLSTCILHVVYCTMYRYTLTELNDETNLLVTFIFYR